LFVADQGEGFIFFRCADIVLARFRPQTNRGENMKISKKLKNSVQTLILIGLVAFGSGTLSVHAQADATVKTIGPSIEYWEIGVYSKEKLSMIQGKDLDAFLQTSTYSRSEFPKAFQNPSNSVRLFKVRYLTSIPELGGRPTMASGLLAIPEISSKTAPLVSYQHGTVFERQAAPSNPSECFEMELILSTFASQGYIAMGADYIGIGDSREANTYGQPGASVQSSLDFLLAVRGILQAEGLEATHLFLHGWSQGGYNTLQFLRRLEMIGQKVDGAVVAAPPTDIRLWLSRLMNNRQPSDAPWIIGAASNLIMAADAYAIPGLALQAIRTPYLESARKFFNFEIGVEEFLSRVPLDPKDFFYDEFRATGTFGNSLFWYGAERFEAYRWAVKSPLRVYYGEVDEVIPPELAKLPELAAKLFGSQTKSISAGAKADHRGAYIFSLLEAAEWYQELMKR